MPSSPAPPPIIGYSLTRGLRRAAAERPDHPAIASDEVGLTYAALAGRVARLAGVMRGLGLGQGDRAAMLALSSHRYLEFYFAPIWAGGVMVPLNHRLAVPELRAILQDCTPRVLVVDRHFAALVAELGFDGPVLHAEEGAAPAGLIAYEAALADTPPIPEAGRGDGDLACLFYTGGTTGRSKGVMLSHTNLLANAMTALANLHFDRHVRHLHAGPLFHLAAGARVYTTTLVGGTHIVIPQFSVEGLLDAVETHRPTHAVFVPTMVHRLLGDPEVASRDLSSLRHLSYGAAPMAPATIRRWMAAMPWCTFTQSYGMTELSPVASSLNHEDHQDEARLATVGRAVWPAEIRIVDADDHEVPRGRIGEIAIAGPQVMLGYWNLPELTATTLRGGFLHTGDAGWMDEEGFITLVDRVKDMIISGGENVYSVEVETALYSHPDVLEAAVIGIPHEEWGEQVHAIVRLREGAAPDAEALIAHCRARIASYKCPKSVDFRDSPMPISSVNKILKSELRAPYWAGRERSIG